MNLRTVFPIEKSEQRITYSTPVMFTGSCFASEIGDRMAKGKMKVMINPSGTLFNPVSVMNTIDMLIDGRIFTVDDLLNYNGNYHSLLHYSSFSSDKPSSVLSKINRSVIDARSFLSGARFLFVTFGTARIYRLRETGMIVSNCHKIPSSFFSSELLEVNDIVKDWFFFLDRLNSFNKEIRVIFTISPVRHWKDGAHGNQVSKSVLFLAVEKMLGHNVVEGYFPGYEILMDDLRDYRFYGDDMLHPSSAAVDYIWDAFTSCYFDKTTSELWKKVSGIRSALNHRFISDSDFEKRKFAGNMLKRIDEISRSHPDLDFDEETKWFRSLTGGE